MHVVVELDAVTLKDPANCREFALIADPSMSAGTIDSILRALDFGRMANESHAWIRIDSLQAQAVGPDGCDATEFGSMVGYARQHGWVEGDSIRAHIERPSAIA